MSLAENGGVAILIFVLVVFIMAFTYAGLKSVNRFGTIMFLNRQAARELRQQQRQEQQELEAIRAVEEQTQANPGGGGGGQLHGGKQQTSKSSRSSDVSVPTATSSTEAQAGR